MPMYEYRCKACKTPWMEGFASIAKRDEVACPACSRQMERKVGGAQLIGPTDTKPVMLANGHVAATSAVQVRKYEAIMGEQTISTKGKEFQDMKWRARNEATKMVEKIGYSSIEDFRANHSARVDAGEVESNGT